MNGPLTDKTVLVIGRGSGIARAVTVAARAAGATCAVAGRDHEKLAGAYDDDGTSVETVGEDGRAKLYAHAAEAFPARRVGEASDIAGAVLFCMTNRYLTGMTLQVDGGEALV